MMTREEIPTYKLSVWMKVLLYCNALFIPIFIIYVAYSIERMDAIEERIGHIGIPETKTQKVKEDNKYTPNIGFSTCINTCQIHTYPDELTPQDQTNDVGMTESGNPHDRPQWNSDKTITNHSDTESRDTEYQENNDHKDNHNRRIEVLKVWEAEAEDK
ncbi:MAG: hypothetical protein GF349_04425 [Candidatus Magasanikbacteria bacterium]|nr:hypothetical protein [Candidatus Magasanikbacteria bacterium]